MMTPHTRKLRAMTFKVDIDKLEPLKVEYDHKGDLRELLATLKQMLQVYNNPANWATDPFGELPHHLTKGMPYNFRPKSVPTGGGRAFAAEMIEKIDKFCRDFEAGVAQCGGDERTWEMKHDLRWIEKVEYDPTTKSATVEGHPEQVEFAGGAAASSKIPPLHLIPTTALEKTAERFALGVERKGEKSWNAISQNQQILTDVDFLIERTAHIIHHAAKMRDRLVAYRDDPKKASVTVFRDDDDASAIVWGGMFLQCAVERLKSV